jgi:hypothetical protein
MSLINNGSVTIEAESQSNVDATAIVQTGIYEEGNAPGDALVNITNAGSLDVHALASAVTAVGTFAEADAVVNFGIAQHANAGSSAAITLSNQAGASISIGATAFAAGAGTSAFADANIGVGIDQSANSGAGDGSGERQYWRQPVRMGH